MGSDGERDSYLKLIPMAREGSILLRKMVNGMPFTTFLNARRWLQFKKVVNGRINTLSHSGGKVRDVSDAVVDAIAQASRDNDDAAARAPGGGRHRADRW
jgi:hypothetical protein